MFDTLFLFIGFNLVNLFNFLIQIFYSKFVNSKDFVELIYFLTYVSLQSSITLLLPYIYVKFDNKKNVIINQLILIYFFVICLINIFFIDIFFHHFNKIFIYLSVSLFVLLNIYISNLNGFLISIKKYKQSLLIINSGLILKIILLIILSFFNYLNFLNIISILILSSLIILFTSIFHIDKNFVKIIFLNFKLKNFDSLFLKNIIFLTSTIIIWSFFYNLDIFIFKKLFDLNNTDKAIKIIILSKIPFFIASAISPLYFKEIDQNNHNKRLIILLSLICIFYFILLFFYGQIFLKLIYGNELTSLNNILILYSVGMFFNGFSQFTILNEIKNNKYIKNIILLLCMSILLIVISLIFKNLNYIDIMKIFASIYIINYFLILNLNKTRNSSQLNLHNNKAK